MSLQSGSAEAARHGCGPQEQVTGRKRSMLAICVETALHSKLVADYKLFFAEMSVDTYSMLGEDLSMLSREVRHRHAAG